MINEEFQKLVLEKLSSLEQGQKSLEGKVDNLDSKIEKLAVTTQEDVIAMLQLTDKKIDQIATIQATQGESINILAARQLQNESEIAALKKAQ